MNIFKKLRKPQFAFFLSFLMLFVSCNVNDKNLIEETGDLTFKIGDTTILFNKGDDHLIYYNSNNEKINLYFDSNGEEGITYVSKNRSNENNLLIEFENLDWSMSFKNIEQLTTNSVSLDVVYSDDNIVNQSSIILDVNFTVEQLMSSLIGEHNLGEAIGNASINRCPVCFVVVAIAAAAAAHCNSVVNTGIAACNTGCYTASFCSVDCHDCPLP